MPVLRNGPGQISRVTSTKGSGVRHPDDFDIGWRTDRGTKHRIYVLDNHEKFDPQTFSKYSHWMHGPAVIHQQEDIAVKTTEYHVNDPFVWSWIGRCIKQGYLNGSTITSPHDEALVDR